VTLAELNALPEAEARAAFERCCGAARWVAGMAAARPFADREQLFAAMQHANGVLAEEDWLEAFRHHPKIGDVGSLRAKFASTAAWAGAEQAGAAGASEEVLHALADGNRAYEARFGFIFIVCATGKRADEMLALLQARLGNVRAHELAIAAGEQQKITRLRLEKLLENQP
jgi:2-oxo-4-hydroxy-4-carboxy-5-ureidoimidazoline decarboxylase